jgi:hypothetical protein
MKLSTIVAGSAASVVVLNGISFAQQYQQGQQLSGREVRQFVSGIERDVNQMVQSGDYSRLRQWTQNHVADHAILSRTNSIETEGRSRLISTVTITKPDLLRLQRFALSSMSDKFRNLEDFRLDIQVQNVEPIGDSAAIVRSRITERATIAARGGEGGGHAQRDRDYTTGQGPQPETRGGEDYEEGQPRQHGRSRGQHGGVQIESQATCTHLLERNRDGGQLQIGMGVCDVTTEAQF